MPSVNSSSRPMVGASSTVMTPSLPTLSKASAITSPIWLSWAETVATWAISCRSLTSRAALSSRSDTADAAPSLVDHRLREHGRRGGAVARDVVGLGGYLLGELSAEVLVRVLELHLA